MSNTYRNTNEYKKTSSLKKMAIRNSIENAKPNKHKNNWRNTEEEDFDDYDWNEYDNCNKYK